MDPTNQGDEKKPVGFWEEARQDLNFRMGRTIIGVTIGMLVIVSTVLGWRELKRALTKPAVATAAPTASSTPDARPTKFGAVWNRPGISIFFSPKASLISYQDEYVVVPPGTGARMSDGKVTFSEPAPEPFIPRSPSSKMPPGEASSDPAGLEPIPPGAYALRCIDGTVITVRNAPFTMTFDTGRVVIQDDAATRRVVTRSPFEATLNGRTVLLLADADFPPGSRVVSEKEADGRGVIRLHVAASPSDIPPPDSYMGVTNLSTIAPDRVVILSMPEGEAAANAAAESVATTDEARQATETQESSTDADPREIVITDGSEEMARVVPGDTLTISANKVVRKSGTVTFTNARGKRIAVRVGGVPIAQLTERDLPKGSTISRSRDGKGRTVYSIVVAGESGTL